MTRAETTNTARATVTERISTTTLSPALQRVASVVAHDPNALAFGTVASVAEQASTSQPTVIRLATALGYDGFIALRDAARIELTAHARSDAQRARERRSPEDPVAALIEAETNNVARSLAAIDPATLAAVTDLLDDTTRRVWVMGSAQTEGVASRFGDQLSIVRGAAVTLNGSEFRVASMLRTLRPGDLLVTMDIPRNEAALTRVQHGAVEAGAVPIVLSGAGMTRLRSDGGHLIGFDAASVGPFESLVGLTAVCTLFINAVSARRKASSTARIDDLERVWTDRHLFAT